MVRTASTMLPLGSLLPSFDLPLVRERLKKKALPPNSIDRINNNMLEQKPVLIMILCAHCPFVKHVEEELSKLDSDFSNYIQLLAIASNCTETHPEDGAEFLAQQKEENGWTFPYLLDSDQKFAKSLMAACTPDFFLFSAEHQLIYRGQMDGSRPGNGITPSGLDLRAAIEATLNSKLVSKDQKPSIGCNIKWRKGSEPSWFG